MRNWLLQSWERAGLSVDKITTIRAQRMQILIRVTLALLVPIYLALHSPVFVARWPMWLTIAGAYIAVNLAALAWLRATPWSMPRLLLLPLIDTAVAGLAMWVDGGHASPVHLAFYLIILSNAMFYGNAMLLYTQALAFLATGVVCVLSFNDPRLTLDWPWLALQMAALALVPAYAYGLGRQLETARAARAMAETESVSLLDGMPVPAFVYASDDQGEPRILHANPAVHAIGDWSPRTLAGRFVDAVATPEDGAEMRAQCLRGLNHAQGLALRFLIRGRDAQGGQRRLQCQVMPVHWQGREAGLCLMTDVTESDRFHEQLDEAHRAGYISSLVAGLTHDFRNILTHIIGNAEMLRLECDERLQSHLDVIIEASERGADMITRLLELSHPRTKTPTRFRLQDTLPATVNLARVKLPAHISLTCHLADETPPVLGQPAQIDQIILNLVENAAQAIGDGEGDIVIKVEPDDAHPLENTNTPAIRITVRDTGRGIPAEDLPHIFRPFWTSRADSGGSGLGMAMVKRITEWHHGKVEVDSTPGEGTTIVIWLPAAQTLADAPARTEPTPARPAPASLRPWHILLVDDDQEVRRVYASMLRRMGHHLLAAANGREGAEAFRAHADEIDLVITDYRMPEMNGLDMIRAIRDTNTDTPILMVTGYGEDVDIRECVRLHAHVLHKPVSFQKLAAEIGAIQMDRNADS